MFDVCLYRSVYYLFDHLLRRSPPTSTKHPSRQADVGQAEQKPDRQGDISSQFFSLLSQMAMFVLIISQITSWLILLHSSFHHILTLIFCRRPRTSLGNSVITSMWPSSWWDPTTRHCRPSSPDPTLFARWSSHLFRRKIPILLNITFSSHIWEGGRKSLTNLPQTEMEMASKVCLPRGFKYKLSYNKYRQTMSLQIELNVWGQCWTRTDRCPCAASPPWGGRCWRAAVHGDQLDQHDHGHHSCLWSRSWSTPASSSPQCSPSLNFYQWATCSYGERRGCGPSACWKHL